MKLSEQSWLEYIRRLARLSEAAGQAMGAWLAQHGTADVEAVTDYAYALAAKYGEGSAELACQMYDALAAAAGKQLPPAVPAATAAYGDAAELVRAVRGSAPLLQNGVSRLVKRAGADTTLQNALRDGAEFAWVPHGDSCPFCIALASRGWQRMSEHALKNGHAEHIHANCDCEYAVRFDGKSGVAGYDPEQYLAQYRAADGDLNAMRRAQYAENKDKINAQKRDAYAARMRRKAAEQIKEENGKDVLSEYLENAAPGKGSFVYDDGYKAGKHQDEIKTAQWLHDHLGGDIVLLQESGGLYEKTPDYMWRGKYWELKTTTTEKSADSAVRSAMKQISENPGGIILNYGNHEISIKQVEAIIRNRLARYEQGAADVLVLKDGELISALRHKK